MYSTGTDFYKLIAAAQNAKEINTAADVAAKAKELIHSWTPLRVVKMIVIQTKEADIECVR